MILSAPIPEDIIIHIINNIPFEPKLLSACSTVSHSFTPPCQKRLFSAITLGSHKGTERCKRLYNVLSNASHLALYVRTLTLQNGLRTDLVQDGGGRSLWLMKEPTVAPLLRKLSELQYLTLASSAGILDWQALPAPLQDALMYLFALPTLTSLKLSFTRAPFIVLARSVQLAELNLVRSVLYRPVELQGLRGTNIAVSESLPLISGKPHLQKLSVSGGELTATFAEDLSLVQDITGLRQLFLRQTRRSVLNAAVGIMRISGGSLETFSWTQRDIDDDDEGEFLAFAPYIVLYLTRNLEFICPIILPLTTRFVEIDIRDGELTNEATNPLQWLVRTLAGFTNRSEDTTASSLEKITIAISIIVTFLSRQNSIERCWEQLDCTLTKQGIFPRLQEVTIHVYCPDGNIMLEDAVERIKKDYFPRLEAAGLLFVHG